MKFPILLAVLVGSCGLARASTLTLERTIPLGNVKGRIDHFGVDAAGGRLFVAALGNDSVEVVDLQAGKVVHSITGLTEPQGIVYVPEFNNLYVANGGDGSLRIYDGGTFAQVGSVKFDDDADNVRYDAAAKRIYVGYGTGAIGIVDAATSRTVGMIPMTAHPESFQLEPGRRRMFVNVPRSHAIVLADCGRAVQLGAWAPSAGGNYPMALDARGHRLIVCCRSPATLIVFDTDSGREVAGLDLHRDCDDVYYDGSRKQIYASCGEGFIDVFVQSDSNHYARKEAVRTEPKGRTSLFSGDRIYLALPQRGAQQAEIRVYRIERA